MIFTETELAGAYIIDLDRHGDDRGFFARMFCQNEFRDHGLETVVAQANVGFNKPAARCVACTSSSRRSPRRSTSAARAKRDLKAGDSLEDYGGYATYGEAVNSDEMRTERYLPEGLVAGCVLLRDVAQDEVITYDDVRLPPGRLADRLRAKQYVHFEGDHWLEEHLATAAAAV